MVLLISIIFNIYANSASTRTNLPVSHTVGQISRTKASLDIFFTKEEKSLDIFFMYGCIFVKFNIQPDFGLCASIPGGGGGTRKKIG